MTPQKHKFHRGKSKGTGIQNPGAFVLCARHARDLDGESPLRGLIAPTVKCWKGVLKRWSQGKKN